jgi:dTDP-4-dehydrorhamnose reductase
MERICRDREQGALIAAARERRHKLLITGASGFLGWNICRIAVKDFEVFGLSHRRPIDLPEVAGLQCDLSRYDEVKAVMQSVRPDAVIHAAAIASPDQCLEDPSGSRRINVDAACTIAGLCSDFRIPCLFTSTDLVFDGTTPPYSEASETSPINLYGEQKVAAEQGMLARHAGMIICRMPLMFGDVQAGAQSSIQPLIRALTEGTSISLFVDEFRTPVSGATAARGILIMLEKKPELIHLGGRERISRYAFGTLVAAALKLDGTIFRKADAGESLRPALRPRDVSFNSEKAFALGYAPQPLQREIEALACIQSSGKPLLQP